MLRRITELLALACLGLAPAAAEDRPNVLLILVDDLGFADLGCQGSSDMRTPHLDALAASGVRCTSGYATAPLCSPSRAGLLTGRYQTRFGHEFNPKEEREQEGEALEGLPLDQTLVSEKLAAAGVTSGLIGKWHLGTRPGFEPYHRGFAEFYGFLGGGSSYRPRPLSASKLQRNETPEAAPKYLTDLFSDEAVQYIERHRSEPWFLVLAYSAPHPPMEEVPEYEDRFAEVTDTGRRTCLSMMAAVDDGVGRVVQTLVDTEQATRTLVFFISDNGGLTRKNFSRNDPFTGVKGDLFEGGVRVPYLVAWPGTIPAGTVYDAPVSTLDVAATVIARAGISIDGLDGVDLVPWLTGAASGSPHEELFWKFGEQRALRAGQWKYMNAYGRRLLFDLDADPGETRNLATQHPDRVEQLATRYAEWEEGQVPALWPGEPGIARRSREIFLRYGTN